MVRAELDREATLKFVRETLGEEDAFATVHAEEVSERVRELLIPHFQASKGTWLPPQVTDVIHAAEHAALMHQLIALGRCNVDELAQVTNIQAATMVAVVTPDARLSEAQRNLQRRGDLSGSDIGAQVLVLADVACHMESLRIELVNEPSDSNLQEAIRQLAIWYDDIQVLQHLRNGLLRRERNQLQSMLLEISDKAAAELRRRQTEAAIRKNMARNGRAARKDSHADSVNPFAKRVRKTNGR